MLKLIHLIENYIDVLEIEKERGEKGYFEYNYLIYEKPHFIELEYDKNNPDTETPTQINTNIQNTKKQIDKDDKTKISSFFCARRTSQINIRINVISMKKIYKYSIMINYLKI